MQSETRTYTAAARTSAWRIVLPHRRNVIACRIAGSWLSVRLASDSRSIWSVKLAQHFCTASRLDTSALLLLRARSRGREVDEARRENPRLVPSLDAMLFVTALVAEARLLVMLHAARMSDINGRAVFAGELLSWDGVGDHVSTRFNEGDGCAAARTSSGLPGDGEEVGGMCCERKDSSLRPECSCLTAPGWATGEKFGVDELLSQPKLWIRWRSVWRSKSSSSMKVMRGASSAGGCLERGGGQ
mmetsp:Transcript_5883/g.18103  ORF Transcript_5883/g.18103 Transcript_5883/m.18103 type:complete len:244 (-) Transcript_5883:11-742(-)